MLEVAAVIVLRPMLKTIRYRPKPRAPDIKKRPICFILKGGRKLLNFPIIKRKILAKTHLKKPKAPELKCVKAKRENGKDEAKQTMAIAANKYDFVLFDIIPS